MITLFGAKKMEAIEAAEHKGYKIEIHHDDCGESPRNWDNICVFHIGHQRYSFGDVNHKDIESLNKAVREAHRNKDIVLPLYMYDHSGITISLSPFSCRWDSGQVGFVVVPRLKMMEEFSAKIFHPLLRAKGLKVAQGEVEIMDKFVSNQVYGFKIFGPKQGDFDDDDCREELEACWGFYGEVAELIQECKGSVDWMVDAPKREREKCCSLYL